MFTRIVSQLSLSPSAASGLAFYARRLAQERVSRTFSAIAAVLIVGLQFATIIAPPTPVNAASPSDIIYGGVTSLSDLLNRYDENQQVRSVYGHFGVTRADIAGAKLATINTLDRSYKTLGRVQHQASDTPVSIGGTTYWQRGLYTFDTGTHLKTGSSYKVYQGTRSFDGGYFAVMMLCGNIVVKANPVAPKPTPPPPPKPTPVPTPVPTPKAATLACTKLQGAVAEGLPPLTVNFTGQGAATGQTISEYLFDFGDSKTDKRSTGSVTHVYQSPGKFTAHLQVKGSSGKTTDRTAACDFTVNVKTPPAAFNKAKTALNLTQNIDATTKPAKAGDQIRYTLTTKNVGGTAEGYEVVEHLEDVLEYASVTDTGGGQLANGVMTWPATTVNPGATLAKSFVVTIKNPIPSTPVGLSDPNSYDLRLDNIYGNAVHISLAPPLSKQVEGASTSLPDTGAGLATVIVLTVSAFSLFFYFRNRQLMTEIRILRGDYQGGLY